MFIYNYDIGILFLKYIKDAINYLIYYLIFNNNTKSTVKTATVQLMGWLIATKQSLPVPGKS